METTFAIFNLPGTQTVADNKLYRYARGSIITAALFL
jgi:hypothetical protein